MTRLAVVAVRRSIGGRAFPALLVLLGLHVLARARPWTHEWLWSIYQFHFSTVLLGPAAAGLAAWEGFRTRRAEDVLESSGRADRAIVLSWAAVFAWVLVAYGVGLLTVAALVKISGTPSLPGVPEFLSLFPAVALLAGETSTSFAVGWRIRSPLVAPAAAIVWFLATMFLYISGPEAAIRVGGATTSLVGLRPRPDVQVAQVLFYVSLTAVSLAWARRRPQFKEGGARALRLGNLAVLVLAAVLLAQLSPNVLETASSRLECTGSDPTLCSAPGYVNLVPEVRAALHPYVVVFEQIGVEVPARFEQGVLSGTGTAASLPIEIFLRPQDHEVARSALLQWYVPAQCDISVDTRLIRKYLGLDYWLEAEVTGGRPYDPTLPRVLTSGTEEEQTHWVRGALADLQACTA